MKGEGQLSSLGQAMSAEYGNANSVMNLPIPNLELNDEGGFVTNEDAMLE
jgi:hypothetical protein